MRRICLLCTAALILVIHSHFLLERAAPALLAPFALLRPPSTASGSGCAPRGLRPHVLVYNRLEKTGSSTLYSLIDALAVRNNFTHVRLQDFYNATAANAAIGAALLQPQRSLVSEHFAFPEHLEEGLKGRVSYMQVVRAPVERCVSWYHWSRYSWPNPWTQRNLALYGNATLDECMAPAAAGGSTPACLNCPPLHQAQAFCGANGGQCHDGTMGSTLVLQQAARHIEAHYPIVGLTEQLEATLALLEVTFPQFFEGALAAFKHPDFRSQRVFKGRAARYPHPSNATRRLLSQHLRGEEQLYAQLAARLAAQKACLERW